MAPISQEIPTVALFTIFFVNKFSYLQDIKKENKTRSGFSAVIWAVLDWKT